MNREVNPFQCLLAAVLPLIAGLFLAALLGGCGRFDRKNKADDEPLMRDDALDAKAQLYRDLQPTVADADGFTDTDTCDSIHWAALRRAAGVPGINLRAAMDPERRLHRRPLGYAECFPDHSKSTVSGDVMLYWALAAFVHKDRDALQDVFSYGKEHGFVMGEGSAFDTFMRPDLQGLYARAIKRLGGPNFGEQIYPDPQDAPSGFAAQLQVVSILAEGAVDRDAISDAYRSRLRAQAERQPNNALFACAALRYGIGDVEHARALLSDERYWPATRLPTSADRCESWLTQRDEGKDWEPCPDEGRTHSGGDFLFAYAVCRGEI